MALSEHCLPAHSLNLKGVPRRGEQCPVENNSYKGYSPPKCTCNAISHIQVKTYTFLLKCLHAMDENVTHPVPCPESSPTPSHMHMPSVKTVIYVPSMTIFFQNKTFCVISKTHLIYQNLVCLYICGQRIFGFSQQDAARLFEIFTGFHRW